MRLLFAMGRTDEIISEPVIIRPSVRAIIRKEGLIAMIYSTLYGYYKFPGGGIERDEDHLKTLCREVTEESGLIVIERTVIPYGYVHRIEKSEIEGTFIQDNYYYFCDVENRVVDQCLDDYEAKEGFVLKWVDPVFAIDTNLKCQSLAKNKNMLIREAKVLTYLLDEGYITSKGLL